MASIPYEQLPLQLPAYRRHGNVARVCPQCGKDFYIFPGKLRTGGGIYCTSACYHAARTRPLADRFWSHVDTSGGPDACWPWTASVDKRGYGQLMDANKNRRTHRVAWELAHGPIPAEMEVCHRCDTPRCCHAECEIPGCEHLKDSLGCQSHLFLGSRQDNAADAVSKGRTARGERNAHAKLRPGHIRAIRAMYAAGGYTHQQLAEAYGVTRGAIEAITEGRNWKHL